MFESFRQDVSFGWRQLRQSPGFTLVAVLSLALGIGANTSMFQLVDAIRLRMLPVKDPGSLAVIDFQRGSMRSGWFSTRSARFTTAQWEEIQQRQKGFSSVMAWSATRFNLANGGETRPAEGLFVSGDFFKTLGVEPIMGRTITAADDTKACPSPGAVISHGFWQREFGGRPNVLNQTVSLNGRAFPVIGVTPPAFFGVEVGQRYDVAVPMCTDPQFSDDQKGRMSTRIAWWVAAMGRLKPGVTLEQASAQLKAVSPIITQESLPPQYKEAERKRYLTNKIEAQDGGTGVSGLRRQYESPLYILMATTGLVLLIACANLANLLLARASVREREIAVRLALGASRGRLVRQLLVESMLLAFGGAVLGLGLAEVLSRGLVAFISTSDNQLFLGLGMNWHVLGFGVALSFITCLLFGLVPAWRATAQAPALAIRSGGRGSTAGRERFSLRRTLVATQVALSVVLLVGAFVFVRSLRNLLTTDAGFQSEGIMTVNVDFSHAGYEKERRHALYLDLRDRLAAIPGVTSVAQVGFTPVSGSGWNNRIGPDGAPAAGSGKESNFNRVSPGYFHTMGTGLIGGREFTPSDNLTGPKVAIVNEKFAQKFLGTSSAVGRTFRMEAEAGEAETLYQIVGVVKNTKYYELREEFVPIAFLPMAQDADPGPGATYVVRVQGSPGQLMNSVKATIGEVSPTIGIEFRSFSAQLQESLLRERLMATLSGGFAFLAGLLATMGLYGVISYMVARRKNEIGVRIALGADRMRVITLVLREAVLLLAIGLGIGLLIAIWSGRAAATLLFGLKPYDPLSLIAAAAMLTVVALAASYGPARRAAAMEPTMALRDE